MLCSGADIRQVKREDAGPVLADTLRNFLFDLQVEDGLGALGYGADDVPALVKGTVPQVRSGTPGTNCHVFPEVVMSLPAPHGHSVDEQQ